MYETSLPRFGTACCPCCCPRSCPAGPAAEQRGACAAGAEGRGPASRCLLPSRAAAAPLPWHASSTAPIIICICIANTACRAQTEAAPLSPPGQWSVHQNVCITHCEAALPQTLGPFCAALSAAEVFSSLVNPPPAGTYTPVGARLAGSSSSNGDETGLAEAAEEEFAADAATHELSGGEDGCLIVEEDRRPARQKPRAMIASGDFGISRAKELVWVEAMDVMKAILLSALSYICCSLGRTASYPATMHMAGRTKES